MARSTARSTGRQKHISFYRLIDACSAAGCPLCRLAEKRVEQFFDGLLYEKVNDPEIRRRFREAGGFCRLHSLRFIEYHDGLAGSILYSDLLTVWLENPAALPTPGSSGELPGCPACREKAATERAYLTLLEDFLADKQLKEALAASEGLCLPHYSTLARSLRSRKRRIPEWLQHAQRERVKKLLETLRAHLDSSNYSLGADRPRLSREQELSWMEAVSRAAGLSVPAAGRGR